MTREQWIAQYDQATAAQRDRAAVAAQIGAYATEPDGERGGVLLCPSCGSEFTHVDRVVAQSAGDSAGSMWCQGEDENAFVDVHRNSGAIAYGTPSANGPRPIDAFATRRHSIALIGRCELCPQHFIVHFTQHKGATFCRVETFEGPEEL